MVTRPILRQDFSADFAAMLSGVMPGYEGKPYAFVRYGDGEAAIIAGRSYRTQADGWTYPGGFETISARLCNSLCCSLPGYYVGLPSPTYEPDYLADLMPFVRVPYDRITWAKIFVDSNYRHFRDHLPIFFKRCAVVSSSPSSEYVVPANGVHPYWGDVHLARLIKQLRRESRPILVAAGPLSNVIIHHYWQSQPDANRVVILDVGSAIDLAVKGHTVRVYSRLHHQSQDWAQFIGSVADM
jgi:hypothetical protein